MTLEQDYVDCIQNEYLVMQIFDKIKPAVKPHLKFEKLLLLFKFKLEISNL